MCTCWSKACNGALCLVCHHYIHEIMLEEVFSSCLGPSSAPEIQVFRRFKEFWPNFVHSDFSPGIRDDTVQTEVDSETHQMMTVLCILTARYGAPQRRLLRWVLQQSTFWWYATNVLSPCFCFCFYRYFVMPFTSVINCFTSLFVITNNYIEIVHQPCHLLSL